MIPIEHEPKIEPAFLNPIMERCAFCKQQTRFWYVPNDVAVCPDCAQKHDVSEVPTKREWCKETVTP